MSKTAPESVITIVLYCLQEEDEDKRGWLKKLQVGLAPKHFCNKLIFIPFIFLT